MLTFVSAALMVHIFWLSNKTETESWHDWCHFFLRCHFWCSHDRAVVLQFTSKWCQTRSRLFWKNGPSSTLSGMVFNFFKSIFGEDDVLFSLGQGERKLGTCRPLCGFAIVIMAFYMVTFQSCQFYGLVNARDGFRIIWLFSISGPFYFGLISFRNNWMV